MSESDRLSHRFRNGKIVLYKRARSSFWQAQLKYAPCKYKRISTKSDDLDEALEVAEEKLYELNYRIKKGEPPDSRRFRDVVKLAINQLQSELDAGYGKVIYKDYIAVINKYFIPFFKNTHVDNIDFKRLKEFDGWRTQQLGRVMSKSGIKNHNAALNYIFDIAIQNGWLLESLKPVLQNTGKDKNKRAYLNDKEIAQLIRFMKTWYNTGHTEKTRMIRTLLRDYIHILVHTGIRHGTEAEKLKWMNIEELEQGGIKYIQIYVDGKTGQRSLIARHLVRRYLDRIASRFDDLKSLNDEQLFKVDEYVFRLEDGTEPRDLHGAFEDLLKKSNLLLDSAGNRRSLYSLRHTYATTQLQNGVDYVRLSANMGTSIQMLEQHYSHIVPNMVAKQLAGEYKEFVKPKRVE
jgi:integrase